MRGTAPVAWPLQNRPKFTCFLRSLSASPTEARFPTHPDNAQSNNQAIRKRSLTPAPLVIHPAKTRYLFLTWDMGYPCPVLQSQSHVRKRNTPLAPPAEDGRVIRKTPNVARSLSVGSLPDRRRGRCVQRRDHLGHGCLNLFPPYITVNA